MKKFRVSGFGFRVSGFGFRVSGFGFRVSGLEDLGTRNPELETRNIPKDKSRQERFSLATFALITLNLNYILRIVPGFEFRVSCYPIAIWRGGSSFASSFLGSARRRIPLV